MLNDVTFLYVLYVMDHKAEHTLFDLGWDGRLEPHQRCPDRYENLYMIYGSFHTRSSTLSKKGSRKRRHHYQNQTTKINGYIQSMSPRDKLLKWMGRGDIVTDRWLQQIPGVTSEICVWKKAALGSAAQAPSAPRPPVGGASRGPEPRETGPGDFP